jgi:hypothetical protein
MKDYLLQQKKLEGSDVIPTLTKEVKPGTPGIQDPDILPTGKVMINRAPGVMQTYFESET